MSEIKNPEQQMDKPSVENSPEKLRETEASRNKLEDRLDSNRSIENTSRTENPEQKTMHGDRVEPPAESKEKLRENKLDNMNSEGKANDQVTANKEADKVEQEKSKFSADNFKPENSYDAKATKETRELASKAHSELIPMGGDTSVKREAREPYTAKETATLKAERERVDAPTRETVMQKVIGVDSGNIEKDLSRYTNPVDRNGRKTDAQVWGFVAKAEDSAPYTKTPKECHENLRLDYEKTEYKNPNQSVYVLRFTDGTNYDVPYNKEFGGTKEREQPCTGNGYIGNGEHMIPEYEVRAEKNKGATVTDGTIYRVNPDGSETAVAQYDEDKKRFVLC